ncbi:hypothetical protein EV426DRAFT_721714 [Tirmania nivea]|nr:hypothetical protein EV426DRAFT_721714 [Tirmania nivea]
MAMWWEKHEADIHVDDEDKKLMEEFTGRLPILFQRVSDIGQVGAAEGIDSVQLQRQKLVKLPEVVKIIGAINAYAISKINQLNADGNDSAMQSCNIARAVAASRLREIESLPQFAEKWWLNLIAYCRDNAAVLGFLVERAVLGVLIQRGSVFAGREFDKPLVQQKFMERIPTQPPTNTPPVIYIPTMYNYEGVDAILAICPKVKKDNGVGEKLRAACMG